MSAHAQVEVKREAAPARTSATPASAPFGLLQRKCACGGGAGSSGSSGSSGECSECKRKKSLQRQAAGSAQSGFAPPIVHEVLHSPGEPLDAATRAFFEPRFGHDFGKVRIHADARANESARSVNALAYTVGPQIVFGAGQYQPNDSGGMQLLGHELTHVVQQRGHPAFAPQLRVGPLDDAYEREASRLSLNLSKGERYPTPPIGGIAPVSVQRVCGPGPIGHPTACTGLEGDIPGERYLFRANCDDFLNDLQEKRLRAYAATLADGASIKIHGFASEEGDPEFNADLSCARALKGQGVISDVVVGAGKTVTYERFAHGGTAGDRVERRNITIEGPPAAPKAKGAPPPKTVKLNISKLEGSTRSTSVADASKILENAANITISTGNVETLDKAKSEALIGTDLILDEYTSVGHPTAEETALTAVNRTAGAITAYFVKAMSHGSHGESFWPSGFPSIGPSVAIKNDDSPFVAGKPLAHELTHVLLDDGGHSGDDTNLMSYSHTGVALDTTQVTKARSSSLVK
jgi:hypothetical protein